MIEPQPGEVWVITEPRYGEGVIPDYGPFIVTHITRNYIGFVAAGDGVNALTHMYLRHRWDWATHATRIWPPTPSWDELAQKPGLLPDDLRAQAME